MRTRRGFLIGGAGAGVAALAALGYRAWDRGVWTAGQGDPYAPGLTGAATTSMASSGRCARRSWQPIRTTPNHGCSGLVMTRLMCLPIVPAIWELSILSAAKCTSD